MLKKKIILQDGPLGWDEPSNCKLLGDGVFIPRMRKLLHHENICRLAGGLMRSLHASARNSSIQRSELKKLWQRVDLGIEPGNRVRQCPVP